MVSMNDESERLLPPNDEAAESPNVLNSFVPSQQNSERKRNIRWLMVQLIIILVLFVGIRYCRGASDTEALQQYFSDIARVELHSVKFKGWHTPQSPEGPSINNITKAKKMMLVNVKGSLRLEYKSKSTVLLTKGQKRLVQMISGGVLRSVCFTVDQSLTFADTTAQAGIQLLSASIPERVCLNLGNNQTTVLDLDVYAQPHIRNIVKVLKVIEGVDNNTNVSIWSDINMNIGKPMFQNGMYWGLGSVHLSQLRWDKFIPWDSVRTSLRQLNETIQEIIGSSKVENLSIYDAPSSDEIVAKANIRLTNKTRLPSWLHLSEVGIPSTNWGLRVQLCAKNELITLDGANATVEGFDISDWDNEKDFIRTVELRLRGPLPEDFLYKVCTYKDGNVVTPTTLMFQRLFNPKESVEVGIYGKEVMNDCGSNSVPHDFLLDLVKSIDLLLFSNYTLDSESLIDEVTMHRLHIRLDSHLGGQNLVVTGTIVVTVDPQAYKLTNSSRLSVTDVKGIAKLYHDGEHFLSTPISTWKHCDSKIVNGKLQFAIEINQEEVEIINRLELSRCLNEVVLKGQAVVYIDSWLDVITNSTLGEVVLYGVPGNGKAEIKKNGP